MQNYNNVLFIPRGDNFDRLFVDYLSHSKELHTAFHTPKFTVGDTDVAYRVINHWDETGLMPDGFDDKGGWRLFSLIEMVWLQIILHLRQFGLSLEQIKRAKEGIAAWDTKTKYYTFLEYYLAAAVASDLNVYALVDQDGKGGLASDDEIETFKFMSPDADIVMISLKGILRKLGFSVTPGKIITVSDTDVAEAGKNVKEVRIKKKRSGEEIETIEEHLAESIGDIQKRLHDSGAFGEMTIKYENGKEQSAEVKIRKRIKR